MSNTVKNSRLAFYSQEDSLSTKEGSETVYQVFNCHIGGVDYIKDTDDFKVRVKHLPTDAESEERFTHVIVAAGTFQYANIPNCPGLEQFKGQVLHSKDVKHMEDFKGQRLVIIGARLSVEDLAIQVHKFGAKSVVISWRTMPHGQGWVEFPETTHTTAAC